MNEVIEFEADRDSAAWNYCKAFPKGTKLYAIKHMDRYFSWYYLSEQFANEIATKVVCDYNLSNWKPSLNQCHPSDRT